MDFTFTEKNGSKPIDEWLIRNLKNYAEREHGIKLDIKIKNDTNHQKETSIK